MNTNDLSPKIPKYFCCTTCDYTTSNKKDYTKHINTTKHILLQNTMTNEAKNPINHKYICECGKKYVHSSSLWNHKKKCMPIPSTNTVIPETQNELITFLLNENKEFKQMLLEMASKPTINNNNCNNNNQFNIHLFLNEKCKDAMNITDFIQTIKLTFEDLLNTEKLGYVKGISNIIVNGLRQLEVCKRPIHCSDVKRETIYVKDRDDKWGKDDEDKNKLKELIRGVSNKNSNQILPWADATEGSDDGTHKNGHLFMRIAVAACGGNDEELNKVVSLLAPKIAIDKTDL